MVRVKGVPVPTLLYGTAWKEERTEPLVRAALTAGFRGIDTANQRRHYHEAGVGAAVTEALASGAIRRDDLFLQSKFTYVRGQDHRLPYDPSAPLATQVRQSFESSLRHLGVDTLDAYLLHGPSSARGLTEDDRETWRAMEALAREGRVRLLGVSNVSLDQLEALYELAEVKPALVQNRTFTRPAADAGVREFCQENGLGYQGFSLLTAIPHVLAHADVRGIALRLAASPAEVVLRWCLGEGMIVLTGTTSTAHMAVDLAAPGLALAGGDADAIRRLVAG